MGERYVKRMRGYEIGSMSYLALISYLRRSEASYNNKYQKDVKSAEKSYERL